MESEEIAKTKQKGGPMAENSDNTNTKTVSPTKPSDATDGDASETSTMPADMGEAPEMNCEENEDGETTCEPPEMPEDMEGFEGRPMEGEFPGELTSGSGSSDSILHPVAYLSLGAGSVILSTIIMYACFSNFFHKKPAATFDKWQKFMWFIVALVVLSVGLITLCYFIPIWMN